VFGPSEYAAPLLVPKMKMLEPPLGMISTATSGWKTKWLW